LSGIEVMSELCMWCQWSLRGARPGSRQSSSGAAIARRDSKGREARGLPRFAFDARRAMAAIEAGRSSAAGPQLMAELKRDAKARGYGLYAR
jgi:hypothetical protein